MQRADGASALLLAHLRLEQYFPRYIEVWHFLVWMDICVRLYLHISEPLIVFW